jgi:hypothetical protein
LEEVWRDIPGYEGLYEASDKGRIRTKEGKTTSNTLYSRRVWKQRILKPKGKRYQTGYRVSLWRDGECKEWLVARLIAITFCDKTIGKLTVNHKDGNRFNNNVENLELVTLADNIRHAFKTGLHPWMHKIVIKDKRTNAILKFNSLSEASRYFNKNSGYMSGNIKKRRFENDLFRIIDY